MIWLDFETRSECDLKVAGVYNYARHPTTEVLCMSYAEDDGPVRTWRPGESSPEIKGQIRAHNAAFERLIFWHVLKMPIPLEQFYCTAAQARANCAPGSLEDVGRFAGTNMRKDHRGAALVRACCIPPYKDDLIPELIEYCEQDVRTMRAVSQAMRELTPEELEDYHVNERINDRGVLADVPLCHAAVKYAADELAEIQETVRTLTRGEILSVRSPKMRLWVQDRLGPEALKLMERGDKFSIDKTARANLLAIDDPEQVPPDVREVIQCADDLWASSVAKFDRLAKLAGHDHRVRGAFVFAGGSATGRASSYGAQVHNFTRKCAEDPAAVRHAMVRGHSIVPQFGRRVTDVLRGMLRPALIPSPGKQLVVADWSAIEGRVNPWLSGRGEDKLQQFRDNLDPYVVNASQTFGVSYQQVDKSQRQVGKVQELACLSEDTLVLTACGEKRIQDVRPGDFVWDGDEWVQTDGPVYKGEKYVIEYDGLCATPDHMVWVERRKGEKYPVAFGRAAAHGLRLFRPRAPVKTSAPKDSKTVNRRKATMREPQIAGLRDVWGAWDTIRVLIGSGRLCMGAGKSWFTAFCRHGIGSNRQYERLCTGQFALVYKSAKPSPYIQNGEHSGVSPFSERLPGRSIRGQHVEELTVNGADVRTNPSAVEPSQLQTKRRVWDLLNCGPLHRFTAQGRLVHNCGFGGGVGAFAAMGRVYNVHLPEAQARRMVDAWRVANPWAVPFWSDLEVAYTRAVRNQGKIFEAGRISYLFDGQHLWYALPSGRVLCYPNAKFEEDGSITYSKAAWKPAADANEWPRARLWRGLACENVTQATAHDLLREALRRLPDVVLHVHDEIVLETDAPDDAKALLEQVMTTPPAWAEGLPLDVEASVMERYGK